MPAITGQSALIIGGSSGIGFAVAQQALAQGVRVAIASSNPAKVSAAVDRLNATATPNTPAVAGYVCDLASDDVESKLEKLFSVAVEAIGSPDRTIDHIIYTAAVFTPLPLAMASAKGLSDLARLGIAGQVLTAKLATRFLAKDPRSSLTLTGGQIADRPFKGLAVLCAFAGALPSLTRGLALELAPIRVNLVSPGPTETEMWGNADQRAQRREMIAPGALLGKPGAPEEVAEAYIYLMRDSNCTGTVVNSNGGVLIQ